MSETEKTALSHILRAAIDTLGARLGEPAMRHMVNELATKGILNNAALSEAEQNEGVQLIRKFLVAA